MPKATQQPSPSSPATQATPTDAIAVPMLTTAEITEILRAAGAIDAAGDHRARMKMTGFMIAAGDDIYPYNPNTDAPAMRIRIMAPPEQYQGFWFDKEHADYAKREEGFCKSRYDIPAEAREFSASGHSCRTCPFHPFVPREELPIAGGKCAWKGDLAVQVMPADGSPLTGDEQIWTLTLSQTSMIEMRGTRAQPETGIASSFNFMYKLSNFAQEHAAEWGVSPQSAITMALTSFASGGVVADVRLPLARSADKSKTWNVVSLTPVYVETDFTDLQQLPAAVAEDGGEYSQLPF